MSAVESGWGMPATPPFDFKQCLIPHLLFFPTVSQATDLRRTGCASWSHCETQESNASDVSELTDCRRAAVVGPKDWLRALPAIRLSLFRTICNTLSALPCGMELDRPNWL